MGQRLAVGEGILEMAAEGRGLACVEWRFEDGNGLSARLRLYRCLRIGGVCSHALIRCSYSFRNSARAVLRRAERAGCEFGFEGHVADQHFVGRDLCAWRPS